MKRKSSTNGTRINWPAIILTLLLGAALAYGYYMKLDAKDGRELAVMTEQEAMAQRAQAETSAKEAMHQKARADKLAAALAECQKGKK